MFQIRTGTGTINEDGSFSDSIGFDTRSVEDGRRRVRYQGKTYRLMGGIRTPYFICLNNAISRQYEQSDQDEQ